MKQLFKNQNTASAKMKIALMLFIFFLTSFSPENGLYAIQFKSLEGKNINMADYRGKKIIVMSCSANSSDFQELFSLDSLYRRDSSRIVVIAVLAEDIGASVPKGNLKKLLRNNLNLSFPITAISKGKKNAAGAQHPLLRWLTNKNDNTHFDEDLEEDGQLFIISESGKLFAVLKKKSLYDKALMKEILNQQVNG